MPVLLLLLAQQLLLNRLQEPPRIIFDETYYVNDALSFLQTGGVEDSFAVHPPVGKWMIAGSIWIVGDNAAGWRIAGAVTGIAMVMLTYFLSLRLLRSRWQAGIAAVLLLFDGLFLVQARTSMLDIFLAFFVLLGAFFIVRDLQDLDHRGHTAGGLAGRGLRDRWLAGAAFGLAAGTKWSGLLGLAVALILVVGFEIIAHRRTRKGIGFGRLLWVVVGPLLLLPATVYLVSYIPWMVSYEYTTEGHEDCPGAAEGTAPCDASVGDRLHGLWREHGDILRFHRNLESTHSYRAEPYTWPVLGRPVAYFYETCKDDRPVDDGPCEVPPGTAAEILALGNPIFWWSFLALLPLVSASMGRRDPSSWVLGGFYGGLFLPWMVVARPAFLFYMVPAIPFMAVTVAHALGRLRQRPTDPLPWLAGGGAGLTAALSAKLAGASVVGIGIAFAIGWVMAPILVAAAWDRRRRGPDPDEAVEVDPETGDVAVVVPAERTLRPWWPTRLEPTGASALPAKIVTAILLVAVLAAFVWFLPIWTGVPMDPSDLRARWWLSSWI